MIAVIATGGKQYKVSEGDVLRIEKLEVEEGENITFDQVLLVTDEKGADVKVGTPIVTGAKVEAKVLEQGRAKKIHVRKFKAKTRYTRHVGHRQPFTEIEIAKISV